MAIGRRHVAALMKRMGIEAIYRKPNTSKPAGHKIYPHLLRGITVDRPNQVWAELARGSIRRSLVEKPAEGMDITYTPMARGIVYLAAVVDWYSRRVLSWRLSITMEAAFCAEALEEALAHHGTPEIFNTDYARVGEARASIGRYLTFYNGRRPHSSLDRRTPDQAYFNRLPQSVAA